MTELKDVKFEMQAMSSSAMLDDYCTGIMEVMGSNPVGASEYFLGFICNCLSYFTSAKISFTSSNSKVTN